MSSNIKISKVVKINKPKSTGQYFVLMSKLREIELIYKLGGKLTTDQNKNISKIIFAIFASQNSTEFNQKLRL